MLLMSLPFDIFGILVRRGTDLEKELSNMINLNAFIANAKFLLLCFSIISIAYLSYFIDCVILFCEK